MHYFHSIFCRSRAIKAEKFVSLFELPIKEAGVVMPTLDCNGKHFIYVPHLTLPCWQMNVNANRSMPARKLQENYNKIMSKKAANLNESVTS